MNEGDSVYVAGHAGLVGSALVRRLRSDGYRNLIFATRQELDLRDAPAVDAFFSRQRPAYVFLAAAKVGGIFANDSYPADFLRDNLQIELNVIEAARKNEARKLIFLGSSCIYPRDAAQPLHESALLTGPLEKTNEWYAVAKIAGIKLCQAYRRQYGFDAICLMPTNLYGPHDNFDLATSHVLPALLRKFHEAKVNRARSVTVWGSGAPRREFLHVDDLARAAIFLANRYSDEGIINIGTGVDIAIRDLAVLIAQITGFEGDVVYDPSKPDGTPRKLLDISRMKNLGWRAVISLEEGIRDTYTWYRDEFETSGRSG